MFTIDFRNPTNTYAFSIVGNKNVDLVYLYSNLTQYVSYDCYVKILSENVVDEIAIDSSQVSIVNGLLLVKWTMGELATKCKKLKVQLMFVNEQEEKIAQTRVVEIKLGNSIDPDTQVEPIYPSILRVLQEQIDTLKHDSVARVGAVTMTGDDLSISLLNKAGTQVASIQVAIPLSSKVDKREGYGLSQNDFTNALKTKLESIATGAEVNVLEGVQVNGVDLLIVGKKVNIDLTDYATLTDLATKQDRLPTELRGKFLHINNSTGAYEWDSISQDLTETALGTLDEQDFNCLITNGYYQINVQATGLDSTYDLLRVKLSINSNNYTALLSKNGANNYVGVFNIEDEDYIYEISLVLKNDSNMLLLKSTRYDLIPMDALYDREFNLLVDSNNSLFITTEV